MCRLPQLVVEADAEDVVFRFHLVSEGAAPGSVLTTAIFQSDQRVIGITMDY
jgi:hypothetical protein